MQDCNHRLLWPSGFDWHLFSLNFQYLISGLSLTLSRACAPETLHMHWAIPLLLLGLLPWIFYVLLVSHFLLINDGGISVLSSSLLSHLSMDMRGLHFLNPDRLFNHSGQLRMTQNIS